MYYHVMRQLHDISVIIASHRPTMVCDLLDLLCLQKQTAPVDAEIIIVTDYIDRPLQALHSECTWIHLPDKSISRKRNLGIERAAGSICAFIDDDCLPSDNWLSEGYSWLQNHPDVTAVEGRTTIEKLPNISDARTREYRRLEKPGFRTNNLFFRTADLRELGGFDERFTVQREDIDLAFTAFTHGKTYGFHPDLHITHRFRVHEPWDLLKNCWNRRFDPLLYRKHPELYRKYIGSPFTPSSIVTGILHLVFAVTLLRRRLMIPALAADLALSAGLGLRRSGFPPHDPLRFVIETTQCFAALFVTAAALLYGTIRTCRQFRG